MGPSVLWFRHGLRLHDNPALLAALENKYKGSKFLPIFIFDSKSAGTNLVGYNRMRFLLDALADLDRKFREQGGQLYLLKGNPTYIFRRLWEEYAISAVCYEQDCEPIWRERDSSVENLCQDIGVACIEKISHTLWNPQEVIQANGGIPPLTYQMFLHTVDTIGPPPRPVADPDWSGVEFQKISDKLLKEFGALESAPNPEDFDVYFENCNSDVTQKWVGGEMQALESLKYRLKAEEYAFERGFYLPNHANPDILGRSRSLSPHLRFGCLSVRKFYWAVHDLFEDVKRTTNKQFPGGPHITGQLIWREYFYTMSVNNMNYGQMKDNPICLNIPWAVPKADEVEQWKAGKTGFPLIDAAMRQLLSEGWLHHILRNTVASFITRGAMWLSWEVGLQHFLKYLLDADWSVCAGNWMWVSSSAFEKLLDSSLCTCPLALARRLDPNGEYIRRYVPELRCLPTEYVHEPWNAPLEIQEACGCVIGVNYPERILDLEKASTKNMQAMKFLREALIAGGAPQEGPPHCRPSNEHEVRQFFWLVD